MAQLLTRLDVRGAGPRLRSLLPGPPRSSGDPTAAVRAILDEVRAGGDQALRDLTARFDGVQLGALRVPAHRLKSALGDIAAPLREALEVARDNIERYHRSQAHESPTYSHNGLVVRELRRPVDRAGVYVPGGTAPLASTVLMTAVIARVAGVSEVALCCPPGPDGVPPPAVLAAAALAGVDEVYALGGAQAVAAMAYGTESVRSVDLIVGPGNRYVATAERLVATDGVVGVPSAFTGPSEVVVVADATTSPELAAIDLVVQAEHGPDGLSYLVTWSEEAEAAISAHVDDLTAASPRRAAIRATLDSGGYSVLVDGPEQAMEVANILAPEHLELMCEGAESLVELVRAAGAVFVGPWAPASVGDYLAGPSHVLP
ncbi:MAG: histidinol dehydrogenase, partial [Acidimicrobiales bacterium]